MLSLYFFFITQCFLPLISVAQQTQTSTHQFVQSHQSYWDFDDVETVQLFARDGADGDYYGRGMAICGDNIVIGSSLDTFKGVQSGTAYIYSRGGSTAEWNIIGKLFPSLGDDDDHFGWSVACDHNYTIVGAYGDDSNYENGGAVYLFAEIAGKYVENGIFYPSGQVKNENFGWSVAIHGNLVVIGARGNSELYTQCGAVYIFRRIDSSDGTIIGSGDDANDDDYVPVGWVLDDILVPPTQSAYMSYGWSVSLYRNTLVIGAPRADYSTGYVYVYTRNTTYNNYDDDQYYSGEAIGYELVSILKSPDPQAKSYFGQSVSIYEDLIVVGQYLRVVSLSGRDLNGGDDDSSYEITPGGAFVYQKNTISKIGAQRGLRSPYPQQWGAIADLGSLVGYQDYEMFGYSVAVFHDLIAIGAPGDSVVGINSSVYIFSSDDSSGFQTWVPITSGWGEFETSDRQKGKLGSCLALSEGLVLVGDPECVNVMTSVQTGCAYSWFGINRNGHGHDDGTPPDNLLLSDSYESLWISLTVFFSIGLCCILVVLLHRSLKRETVDVVLEDMMTGDIQRMPYSSAHSSFSSLSNSISSFNSSHLPEWLHRYSDNTNDWLFGENEMRPVSSPFSFFSTPLPLLTLLPSDFLPPVSTDPFE
jgi:hypothetical protein